jgi:hypothetical protein
VSVRVSFALHAHTKKRQPPHAPTAPHSHPQYPHCSVKKRKSRENVTEKVGPNNQRKKTKQHNGENAIGLPHHHWMERKKVDASSCGKTDQQQHSTYTHPQSPIL